MSEKMVKNLHLQTEQAKENVGNVFSIFAQRFQICMGHMIISLDKVNLFAKSTCILHTFLIQRRHSVVSRVENGDNNDECGVFGHMANMSMHAGQLVNTKRLFQTLLHKLRQEGSPGMRNQLINIKQAMNLHNIKIFTVLKKHV